MRKPSLVLLHGVGLDRSMWASLTALLHDDYDIVTPDLPGHGARPPVQPGIRLGDLAEGVVGDVPAGAHLVGFSLGALVAQHIAAHNPRLISSLTCVSAVCRRTDDERAAVLARLEHAAHDFAGSASASIQRWYAGTDVPAEHVRRTEAVLRANDRTSFLAAYRLFATADAEIAPLLPEITVRTLAITGEEDPGSTPAMTDRLAAAVPDCRAVIVPAARHMLPVQRPEALASCLTGFIADEQIGENAHV